MSAYQSNSTLARTRPLRANTKSTLTAPPSSTPPLQKAPQIPTCTSNVLLFLTNARLLDLDLESDWPDITPTTFSAKDALGGQKKRIQCVEWALYQLFSLWDHNDAQNKLRPFYPPADQVQSINLRAALVRSLEAAKKNGVLGRDVLIRKTMLDECKGERLEEVLAVFSSAVLKKLVAERALNSGPEYRPSISESISLENWGYTGDRTELNGLLLAYKASLRSILHEKRAARDKYNDFAELLAAKERGLSQRREQAKYIAQDRPVGVSDAERAEVRRTLRNNWTGNEQWVDGLLGGTSSHKRGLLSTPFDEVWNGVQSGNIKDLEGHTTGLLEQLEQRVDRQKSRLKKWEDFRKSNFGDVRPRVVRDTIPKDDKNETGFDFTSHLNVNYDNHTTASRTGFNNPPAEYAQMLNRLTTELESHKTTKILDFSNLIDSSRRGHTRSTSAPFVEQDSAPDPVSDLSDWEDESEEVVSRPQIGGSSLNNNPHPTAIPRGFLGSRRQLPAPRESRKTSPIHHGDAAKPSREHRRPPIQVESQPNTAEDNEFKLSTHDEESRASTISSQSAFAMPPPSRPKSPTQLLADQILNSMDSVSPSPVKKSRYTLSLAERTRMSMTRTISFEPEDETPQHSPVKAHAQVNDEITTHNDPERGEEYEDLITRTRRSMAGFEAARQKAQLERSRSQRKSRVAQRKDSYFPKVDEEISGDRLTVEGLIEGDQDYEAIFKSRPRIATSPAPNPTRLSDGEE
ncbi:HAUS augmin-like complex subunit 6 N-terminus-domain-containing protein [Xylaria arbuscula]|nr:HAUS augmin-like complex subunit 6 N-terminus-domain-containing protein [Xylaria arbuscula]